MLRHLTPHPLQILGPIKTKTVAASTRSEQRIPRVRSLHNVTAGAPNVQILTLLLLRSHMSNRGFCVGFHCWFFSKESTPLPARMRSSAPSAERSQSQGISRHLGYHTSLHRPGECDGAPQGADQNHDPVPTGGTTKDGQGVRPSPRRSIAPAIASGLHVSSTSRSFPYTPFPPAGFQMN